MTDPIRNYIDTHIPENHRQGDGCWDAAQRAMAADRRKEDAEERKPPCPVASPDGRPCTGRQGHYVKRHTATGFDLIDGHSYRRVTP